MPKILFIQPTQYDNNRGLCKQKKIYLPGLVFPLLAAMTPTNWEVEIKLEVVDTITFDEKPDIVAIGTMGHTIFRGLEIAKEFKKRNCTVVMGGYMASMVPSLLTDHVDSVIVGDAEISYPKMLSDFERSGKIKPVYNYPVGSLTDLPVPRYELLLKKPIGNMLPVQAGRGCPHFCSFCSIACIYKGKYLSRPLADVVRDIVKVKELGFNKFYLIDDNIIANPDYLGQLCDKIKKLKMSWASQCSINLAKNPRLLKKVREAGATILSFGLESITQEGLNKLGKSWVKVDEHQKLISIIAKTGILVSSEMIVGTDSDTEDSIRETYEFVQKARIPIPRFYILTPIPGSKLFHQYKEEGRLLTLEYEKYDGSKCIHTPKKISAESVSILYWWLNKKIFSFKSIVLRTLLNPNFFLRPHLYIFAFFVNLHYRHYIKKNIPPNIF